MVAIFNASRTGVPIHDGGVLVDQYSGKYRYLSAENWRSIAALELEGISYQRQTHLLQGLWPTRRFRRKYTCKLIQKIHY